MSFSKISLYSAIFLGGIIVNNQIIAMEEITESIKQELTTLDQNIITLEKALKPAKEQRNKDQEQLYICWRKQEKTRTPDTLFKPGKYTINCDDLVKAYGACYPSTYPEYEGSKYRTSITLNKKSFTHQKLRELFTKGSFYRYYGIKLSLKKDKRDHNQFQDDLERGERVKDLVYLQLLQKKIQKNNQKIQDRNSCLSNRS